MVHGLPGYKVNAERVELCLLIMGKSKAWLSREINRDDWFVGKLLRGQTRLSPEKVDAMCRALDLTPDELLRPARAEQDRERSDIVFNRQTNAGIGNAERFRDDGRDADDGSGSA